MLERNKRIFYLFVPDVGVVQSEETRVSVMAMFHECEKLRKKSRKGINTFTVDSLMEASANS